MSSLLITGIAKAKALTRPFSLLLEHRRPVHSEFSVSEWRRQETNVTTAPIPTNPSSTNFKYGRPLIADITEGPIVGYPTREWHVMGMYAFI